MTTTVSLDTERYAQCIENSKRIRWDIDKDVIRGRQFDTKHSFLPDGLSLADELTFLTPAERRFLSQVQGRTYANMFGLVERFIGAKMLEVGREHGLGDQTALEAIVRFADEELKHQELFRRIEILAGASMPKGYEFILQPNEVASFVLGKSTWAVLALTCHIELFTLAHYRASIEGAHGVSDLFKDVLLYHWREESQHAAIDEMEWVRENSKLVSARDSDAAVDDFIELVRGVDGLLQIQAKADASYFLTASDLPAADARARKVGAAVLKAYRWQYIVSGAVQPRFQKTLGELTTLAQVQRIRAALAPLMYAMPAKNALIGNTLH